MTTGVDEFVALVREYVELVDRAGGTPAHAFLRACAGLLPRIYAAGLDLPDVEPTDEEAAPVIVSPLARVRSFLGLYDSYFEVFAPYVDEGTGRRVAGRRSGGHLSRPCEAASRL